MENIQTETNMHVALIPLEWQQYFEPITFHLHFQSNGNSVKSLSGETKLRNWKLAIMQ